MKKIRRLRVDISPDGESVEVKLTSPIGNEKACVVVEEFAGKWQVRVYPASKSYFYDEPQTIVLERK